MAGTRLANRARAAARGRVKIRHPRVVYLREAEILLELDTWLSTSLNPARLPATVVTEDRQGAPAVGAAGWRAGAAAEARPADQLGGRLARGLTVTARSAAR